MRTVVARIEPNIGNPFQNKTEILSGRQAALTTAASKQKLTRLASCHPPVVVDATAKVVVLEETTTTGRAQTTFHTDAADARHRTVTTYGADDTKTSETVHNDNGSRVATTWYLEATDTRDRTVAAFNAADQKTSETIHNDDGGRTETTFDVAGVGTWKQRTLHYNVAGELFRETRITDDDTTVIDNTVGDDTYTLTRAGGLVTIADTSGSDTLEIAADITARFVAVAIVGNDLIIGLIPAHHDFSTPLPAVTSLGDRVHILGHVTAPVIEQVRFGDGVAQTIVIDSTTETVALDATTTTGRTQTTFHTDVTDRRHRTVVHYNSVDEKMSEVVHNDDGSRTETTWHLEATDARDRTVANYDAAGVKTTEVVHSDDGTRAETTYDVAGTRPWKERTLTFGADNTITAETGINDDGTPLTNTAGNTAYTLARGSGETTIDDVNGIDTLTFAAGIEAKSIVLEIVGNDAIIGLLPANHDYSLPLPAASAVADRVRVINHNTELPVEKYQFADGTVLRSVRVEKDGRFTETTVTRDANAGAATRVSVIRFADATSANTYRLNFYDEAGVATGWTRFARDGGRVEVTNHLDTSDPRTLTAQFYNAHGVKTSSAVFNDDGTRDDTYNVGRGGQTSYTDADGIDRMIFDAGIGAADIVVEVVGDDLQIGILPTNHNHNTVPPAVSSLATRHVIVGHAKARTVEKFEFADGTVLRSVRVEKDGRFNEFTMTPDANAGAAARVSVTYYADVTAKNSHRLDFYDEAGVATGWTRYARDGGRVEVTNHLDTSDTRTLTAVFYDAQGYNIETAVINDDGTRDDTYYVRRIVDTVTSYTDANGIDKMIFEAGITQADLVTEIAGDDLIIGILPVGNTGTPPKASALANRLRIVGHAKSATIERFEFADGAVYEPIRARPSGLAAPIAIDLDGDGVELVSLTQSTAHYDWSGDGTRTRTAWLAADDAWLAIDADADGVIAKSYELAFTQWAPGTTSDLEAVRQVFDSNADGVLDKADAWWRRFRLWRDKSQDGVSQADELKTLDQAGIAAIALTPSGPGTSPLPDGSTVTATASVLFVDGSTGTAGDVTIAHEVNSEAAATPDTTPAGGPAVAKDDDVDELTLEVWRNVQLDQQREWIESAKTEAGLATRRPAGDGRSAHPTIAVDMF